MRRATADADDARKRLEMHLAADQHDRRAIAESLLALGTVEHDLSVDSADKTDSVEGKAHVVLQKIRSRVEQERHALWKQLKERFSAVQNCVHRGISTGAMLAETSESESDESQQQLTLMAELDRLASDHRSCRMEQSEAQATVKQCESAVTGMKSAEQICHPLIEAQTMQKEACNAAQSYLETKACLVEQHSRTCEEAVQCHEREMKAYQAAKERAESQQQHLNSEEHTLLQVECILASSAGASTSHCRNQDSDSRHVMQKDYGSILMELPKPPSVQECLRGHEAKNLLASFFFALPATAPASACTSACCQDGSAMILMELLAKESTQM